MQIIMTKRKPGVYCQWFTIQGINEAGHNCSFLIYYSQAKTYAQAIRFFNRSWPKCKGLVLRNSEPVDDRLALAC